MTVHIGPVGYFNKHVNNDDTVWDAKRGSIEGIKLVYSEGGEEGAGEHVERVFEVSPTDGSRSGFVCLLGYYESYNGTTWDFASPVEVYPREVTRIEYFTEK